MNHTPVLLGPRDLDAWLTGKAGVELLQPAPNDLLRMWPVSTRVNKTLQGDDDPSLIEPVEDAAARRLALNPKEAPAASPEFPISAYRALRRLFAVVRINPPQAPLESKTNCKTAADC
jgi:hypothetical protein